MGARVLQPQISIQFYDVVGGSNAGWRLDDQLGEGCVVTVSYSVRSPAGSCQIVVVDRAVDMEGGDADSVYFASAPMDGVEVRMSHDDESLPLVFRGFVSEVSREEVMGADGTPERRTVITAQSTGKILLMEQIYFVPGIEDSEHQMQSHPFFKKYLKDAPKVIEASEFVSQVCDVVINPALQTMLVASALKVQIVPVVDIQGEVSPYDLDGFVDRSVYDMLSQLCDVGPFNELYVEDEDGGNAYLRLRPNQFYTEDWSPAQDGVGPASIDIDHRDLVGLSVSRSDASVANLYWVSVPQALQSYHIQRFEMYAKVPPGLWDIRKTYENSKEEYYGYRRMDISARLLAPGMLNPDAVRKEQIPPEKDRYGKWMCKQVLALRDQNKDNVKFENGAMTLRGNEKIKAGMYVILHREGVVFSCYAVAVTHHFVPYGSWTTVVHFERGRAYMDRGGNDYAAELARARGAVR